MNHLDALELRLSHERDHLARERNESGRAIRRVWIAQIEKEIAEERSFLGMTDAACNPSDEELLAELAA